MDKQEFLDGFKTSIEEFNNPDSEWSWFIKDAEELRDELGAHDPILGQKLNTIVDAAKDFMDYVKSRAEELASSNG